MKMYTGHKTTAFDAQVCSTECKNKGVRRGSEIMINVKSWSQLLRTDFFCSRLEPRKLHFFISAPPFLRLYNVTFPCPVHIFHLKTCYAIPINVNKKQNKLNEYSKNSSSRKIRHQFSGIK